MSTVFSIYKLKNLLYDYTFNCPWNEISVNIKVDPNSSESILRKDEAAI